LIGRINSSLPYLTFPSYSPTVNSQREELASLISKLPEEMREEALTEIRALYALSKAQEVTYQATMTLLSSLNQDTGSSISVYA